MTQIDLTLYKVDNDNCRVYFKSSGQRLYCYQLEKRGEFAMHECTDDGEPLCHVDMTKFETPFVEGTDSTIKVAREFNDWLGDLVLDHGHTGGLGM
jgi:hypothetical protein